MTQVSGKVHTQLDGLDMGIFGDEDTMENLREMVDFTKEYGVYS